MFAVSVERNILDHDHLIAALGAVFKRLENLFGFLTVTRAPKLPGLSHSFWRLLQSLPSAVLTNVLQQDPQIEVMGVATDPVAAARKIAEEVPDVITLDVEMPRMDGISFLRKIMHERPTPVLMCSTLTQSGAETTPDEFDEMMPKP